MNLLFVGWALWLRGRTVVSAGSFNVLPKTKQKSASKKPTHKKQEGWEPIHRIAPSQASTLAYYTPIQRIEVCL